MIRLLAFDLDGTLTQHRSPLTPENRAALAALGEKYQLVMAGAGLCMRIFNQMEHFPIDIIGSYGMQVGKYNPAADTMNIVIDEKIPVDRESVEARVRGLREKYGYTAFAGDGVQYHSSGCVTIPILGTQARLEDKLAFDPDRKKRRAIYGEVCALFEDYNVFVGGSSSFDMAPRPFNKYYALDRYCAERGISHDEVIFFGDDYGPGGNDESVYRSDFGFIKVDDYREFPSLTAHLLA